MDQKAMICAFCGERAASALEDSRPICQHCAELPEPTPSELIAEMMVGSALVESFLN